MGTHDPSVEAVARELREVVDAATNPLRDRLDRIEVREQIAAHDTPGDRRATPRGDTLEAKHSVNSWVERRGQGDGTRRDDFRLGAVVAALVHPGARKHLSAAEEKAISGQNVADGGALLSPTLSSFVLDDIRARALVVQAGATTIPMPAPDVYIPRIADGGGVEGTWRGEGAAVNIDAPTFERVGLHAKTLAVLVKASYELFEDASPAGLQAIERDIVSALAVAVDKAALVGTGVDGQPLGLVHHTGVASAATDTAPTSYDQIINLVADVRHAGHEPTGIFTSEVQRATYAKLRTGLSGDNSPLPMTDYLSGIPWFTTAQIPSNLGANGDASYAIAGDFRHLYIGARPEMGIRVMSTPHRYADTMQVAILGWTRVDIAVGYPAAFSYDLLRD